MKLTCPPAQSGASVVARAEAATLVQSGASTVEKLRSPRKRGAADQSIGTRKACKITQGTAFEHVVRKPNKPSISWDKPISVELTRCHVGVSNSIDRVGSILRTKHPRVDAVAQSDMGSDNRDSRDKSNQQVEQEPNSSQRAFPANLINIIREIRKEKIPAPTAPEFVFELTSEAAEKNFMILTKNNIDLGQAIEVQRLSLLGYRSEFRPPATLHKIFPSQPLWKRMDCLLFEGSKLPLLELSEKAIIEDLKEALQFGNHKGASEKPVLLKN